MYRSDPKESHMTPACLFNVSPNSQTQMGLADPRFIRPQTPNVHKTILNWFSCLHLLSVGRTTPCPIYAVLGIKPRTLYIPGKHPWPPRCVSLKRPSKPDILAHPCNPRRIALCLKWAWASHWVLGQPGLQCAPVSQEIKTNKKRSSNVNKNVWNPDQGKTYYTGAGVYSLLSSLTKCLKKNRQLKESLFWLPVQGHSPRWQGNHGSERKLFTLGGLLRPSFSLSEVRDYSPGVVSPTVRVGLPTQANSSWKYLKDILIDFSLRWS